MGMTHERGPRQALGADLIPKVEELTRGGGGDHEQPLMRGE